MLNYVSGPTCHTYEVTNGEPWDSTPNQQLHGQGYETLFHHFPHIFPGTPM